MLRLHQLTQLIWNVQAPTTAELAHSFIRFQEYYENPVFKGKKGFSVSDVERWWTDRGEAGDYYTSWAGFNVPGWVILDIVKSETYYPLTTHELQLVALFEDVSSKEFAGGVIIGVGEDNNSVFDHEFAHGLYGTVSDYRLSQMVNLTKLDSTITILMETALYRMGYDKSVVPDEIQAYLSTYNDALPSVFPEVFPNMEVVEQHTSRFRKTFDEFANTNR